MGNTYIRYDADIVQLVEHVFAKHEVVGSKPTVCSIPDGYMLLRELYQESHNSSFTHNGSEYDLNKLFKLTEHTPVKMYDVSDLEWILEYTNVDDDRVEQADISEPILIVRYQGMYAVVDGAHRLTKAVQERVDQLPGKLVTHKQLDAVKIK